MRQPSDMTRSELEDEVLYLREELGLTHKQRWRIVTKLGVSRFEASILSTLIAAKGRPIRGDFLEHTLPTNRDREYDVIRVYICRLRKRLGSFDTIETLDERRGVRYRITAKGLAACEQALAA